jgi:hypothetical protein
MSTFAIQFILGGALGLVLAANGLTIRTWGFWVVVLLVLAMRFVGDE